MNTLKALAILLALGLGCTRKPEVPAAPQLPVTTNELLTPGKVLAESDPRDLPYKVYRFLAADPKDVHLSPLSLEQVFSMLYLGANGKTKKIVEELFGFSGNEVYSLKNETLDPSLNFYWGNSVWLKPGESLSPTYVEALKSELGASFSPTVSASKINSWVATVTQGKIRELIKTLDLNPLLVLVNAIYLKADWESPFDPKSNLFGPFQTSPHMASQVTYLSKKSEQNYFENEHGKWIELPYVGGQLSMIVALPKKRHDLSSIEERLSSKQLDQVFGGFKPEFVDVKLPKFKIETALSFRKVFVDMGYSELFKGDPLRIGEILQATHLKVDEKGTEGAAASAVTILGAAAPVFRETKTFHANEPFLYILRNKKSGKIYFLGRVYSPKE